MRTSGLFLLVLLPLHASILGTSQPAQSLTAARVMALPVGGRAPWLAYLQRSEARKAADKAALAAERDGLARLPPLPRASNSAHSIPLRREPAFYRTAEARRIGDNILSFQVASGGWSKNLDMTAGPRLRGQSWTGANLAPVESGPGDFDQPADPAWHYVGTLDNDATNTQLHYLAKLAAALPGHEGDPYRAAFLRGAGYLLAAQYPNGGWPQVWPLEGGYHDAITFNDDAVTESAEVLTLAAHGALAQPDGELVDGQAPEDYSFVPPPLRARARIAVAQALNCILAAQVRVASPGGKGKLLTVWAQQNDPLTLEPVSARNFEMASLSSGESASVLLYLMSLPRPGAAVVRSVDAAAAWFEAHQIMGFTWSSGRETPGGRETPRGRRLTATPGAGPLWSRYYSLTTGKPIFGDRDKTIHDDVMELSLERRNGYGWYGSSPAKALAAYAEWKKTHKLSARIG